MPTITPLLITGIPPFKLNDNSVLLFPGTSCNAGSRWRANTKSLIPLCAYMYQLFFGRHVCDNPSTWQLSRKLLRMGISGDGGLESLHQQTHTESPHEPGTPISRNMDTDKGKVWSVSLLLYEWRIKLVKNGSKNTWSE